MRRKEKSRREVNVFNTCHAVIDGVSVDKLNSEEMELCRFIVGGVQAK